MFELEDWYVPNTVDIKNYLTDIETKNMQLILVTNMDDKRLLF